MKNKLWPGFDQAVADISDGATIMMHCFGGPAGMPQNLIRALRDKGSQNLTIITCAMGTGGLAGRRIPDMINPYDLVANKQVRKAITGWVGTRRYMGFSNPLEDAARAGEVELELVGQGTLAARIKAGGSGIGAFYNPVGVGTILDAGKEQREFQGRTYLLEYPLRGDFGFVRAAKADELGNLIYRGTARSYNPIIAMACDVVIAEVDEIVPAGGLDPEHIVTPGVFVDRLVLVREGDYGSPRHLRETLARVFLNEETAP